MVKRLRLVVVGRPRTRSAMRGRGWFSEKLAGGIDSLARRTRIGSRIVKLLPLPGAKTIGQMLESSGYGRKKRRRRY